MQEDKKEKETSENNEKNHSEKEKTSVPEKFKNIVKQIEELSVLELSELVKVLEEKFGVSATTQVAQVAVSQASTQDSEKDNDEEKTSFDVEIESVGDSKIAVIKIVRETTGKGLKESKEIVDKSPTIIKEKCPKSEAEELKKKLEEAGAKVNLK